MKINLTDNNIGQNPVETFDRVSIAALFPMANKPISTLCQENENLLIFPYSLGDMGNGIGDNPIFDIKNTSEFNRVSISTSNIMGFIGVGNLQLKIKSRFDEGREDNFLHYMLQRVMRFNMFDLNHETEEEEVFDFMMFMFPYFLKNALKQGLYREYQHYAHNDAKIKGSVNVNTHLQMNVPFAGRVAYSTREYSYDNNLTELIRHTIEFMSTKRYGKAVLTLNRETEDNVNLIVSNTSTYERAQRSAIISKNLRLKVHPYYTAYSPLRVLCLQILRMEEVKYGDLQNEICGILFDGAWLWEEYVNTILSKEGFIHPENKLKKGAIFLFRDEDSMGRVHRSGRRYPDFYKENIVLDAKYKRLGSYEKVSKIEPDDIHQMMAYMETLQAHRGGFVAPLNKKQHEIPTSHLTKSRNSTISILGIEISKNKCFHDFCKEMDISETIFVEHVCNL